MSAAEVLRAFSVLKPGEDFSVWAPDMSDWKPIQECVASIRADAQMDKINAANAASASKPQAQQVPPVVAPVSVRSKVPIFAFLGVVVLAGAIAAFRFMAANSEQVVSGKILIVQKNAEVRKLALVKVQIIQKEDAEKWFAAMRPIVEKGLASSSEHNSQLFERSLAAGREAGSLSTTYRSAARSLGQLSFDLVNLESTMRLRRRGERVLDASSLGRLDDQIQRLESSIPRDIPSVARYLKSDFKKEFDSVVAKDGTINSATGLSFSYYGLGLHVKGSGFRNLAKEAKAAADEPEAALVGLIDDIRKSASTEDATQKAQMYEPSESVKRAAIATSDGDGLFKVKLRPGEYYAIASSTRRVSDSTEEYYWAVKFTVVSDGDNVVMLGNQNLESNDPAAALWPSELSLQANKNKLGYARCLDGVEKSLADYKKARPDIVVQQISEESAAQFEKMKATF